MRDTPELSGKIRELIDALKEMDKRQRDDYQKGIDGLEEILNEFRLKIRRAWADRKEEVDKRLGKLELVVMRGGEEKEV